MCLAIFKIKKNTGLGEDSFFSVSSLKHSTCRKIGEKTTVEPESWLHTTKSIFCQMKTDCLYKSTCDVGRGKSFHPHKNIYLGNESMGD
jgi:hypothetical protein